MIKIETTRTATNPNFTCRKIEEDQRKRKEFTSSSVWQQTVPAKKQKMDHSTPKEKPRANQEYRQALGQESPIETHSSSGNNHQLSPALTPEISVSSMECTPEQKGKTNLSAGTLALDIEHVRNRLGDSSLKY